MNGFEPTIETFETDRLDRFLRGNHFAYIDIVDAMGRISDVPFDSIGFNVKPKVMLTNNDFKLEDFSVVVMYARSRSSFDEIRKAIRFLGAYIENYDARLFDLYRRAHADSFFKTALEGHE